MITIKLFLLNIFNKVVDMVWLHNINIKENTDKLTLNNNLCTYCQGTGKNFSGLSMEPHTCPVCLGTCKTPDTLDNVPK